MTYDIGQVVFVISNEDAVVIPLKIVEIHTVKNLSGEDVTYNVIVLPARSPAQTKVSKLSSYSRYGNVYVSLEDVREVLVERVMAAVNKIVDRARESVAPPAEDAQPAPLPPRAVAPEQQDTITLPDGTVARVRMPQLGS